MGMFDDLVPQAKAGGMFDDLIPAKPAPIGQDANASFLRQELANTDWGTRNIAGFGTALSDLWEGAKQAVGQGDKGRIEANKIIAQSAPVGAITGNVALTAIPFGLAGNSLNSAAKVGTVMGALNPVDSDNAADIVKGKILGAATGGVTAAAGQGLANKAGDWLTNAGNALANSAAKNATRTQTVNDARDAGLGFVPSDVNPSAITNFLESFGGKSATAKLQSARNAELMPDLIRQDLHLPPDAPLTPATLQNARDLAYQVGYKPVTSRPAVNWDPQFVDEVTKLSPASSGGAVKNPAQGPIDDLVSSLTNRGQWTGEQLVRDIRELRNQASNNFRAASMPGGNSAATDLAKAQLGAADAMEGMAQRAISRNGGSNDALQLMREARQYIAQTHAAEDALIGGTDSVDPRVFARMADNQRPLSGNMAAIGNAANVFPRSFQDPTRVGGHDVSVLNVLAGNMLGGAAGEYADHHPLIGAGLGTAGLMLARKGARSAALSGVSQNALRDIYKLGLAPRMAGGMLQYAPVGSAVLGRNALAQYLAP